MPLVAGKDQEFKIRVRKAEKVQIRVGPQTWIPMQRASSDPELFQATTSLPADRSVRIVASPLRGGDTYWTIVDYAPDRK